MPTSGIHAPQIWYMINKYTNTLNEKFMSPKPEIKFLDITHKLCQYGDRQKFMTDRLIKTGIPHPWKVDIKTLRNCFF